MQVESELYSALLDAGVSKEKAERVADIESLRADVFKVLNEQTWKLAGIVLAAMGFVVAAVKLIS